MSDQAKSSDSILLMGVLRALFDRWLTLALVLVACIAIGITIGLLSERIYRADVVLMPVSEDSLQSGFGALGAEIGGLAALAGMNLSGSSALKDESLEVMKSRSFTVGFIERHGLLPTLFRERWDESTETWRDDEAPTALEAYQRFDEEVRSIAEHRATGVLTLSIELADAEAAARWANMLVADLNQEMRSRERERARRSLEYLQTELDRQSVVEVKSAIFRLMEAELARAMMAEVRHDFALKVIDPATTPDEDNFVKPSWPLLLVASVAMGIVLAACIVVMSAAVRFVRSNW